MKYAVEVIKLQANVALTKEEKEPKVREIITQALEEFERLLLFADDVLREILERLV